MAYIMREEPGPGPAGKDRVSSKKRKKSRVTCLGCGSSMKSRDAACRKCGRPSEALRVRAAQKAAGIAFVGKSQRPVCPRCRQSSRPGARHCTSCGSGLLSVVKSAAQIDHDRYMALYRREADPGRREVYWQLANPELFGRKGGRAS